MISKPSLTVKGVKEFRGREGMGFEASLYLDGVKVALVVDSANGGPYYFEWVKPEYEKALIEMAKAERDSKGFGYNVDMIVAKVIDAYVAEKTIRRWCKTKTVFSLPEDSICDENSVMCDAKYHTINKPYTAEIGKQIRAKYPTAIIYNEN